MSSKGSPPIALILLGATATAAVVIAAAFVVSSRTRSKRCGNRNETTASLLDKNSSNEEEDNSTPRIVNNNNNNNSINNDGGGEAITENKVHVSEIAETHNASCQSKGKELPIIIGGGEDVGDITAKEVESSEGQEASNLTSSVARATKKKKKKDKLRPKLTPSTTNNEAETNNNDDDDDDLGFGEIAKTPLKKLRPISTTTPKEKGDKKPPDDLGYNSLSSYWKQQENKNVFVAPITPVGVSRLEKKKKMGDDNKVKSNNSNDVDDDMNIGKKEDSIALALDYPSSTVNEVANQQTNFESDEAPADAMKVVVEDDGAADQGLVEKILLKK